MKKLFSLLMIPLAILIVRPSVATENMVISTFAYQGPIFTMAKRSLKKAYKKLGIDVEYRQFPGRRGLVESNAGRVDGELYRIKGIDKKYTNLVRVPVPVFCVEMMAYTKNLIFEPDGWESLHPYRLGFVRGIIFIERNTAGMDANPVKTLKQALTMLNKDRVDIVIANQVAGVIDIKKHKFVGLYGLEPPVAKTPVFHYVHKKHAALVPQLEDALKRMRDENKIQDILDEIISEFSK